jgi:LacI family transcriptional regulator, galactose operon repressor
MPTDHDDRINQADISHPSESRRVTLKQVAERAGVSAAAASAALTGRRGTTRVSAETAAIIRHTARELGYQSYALARGLAPRQTGGLALALPYAAAFWDGNPFNQAVIHGATEAAARLGFDLLLKTCRNHGWQEWDAASVMDAGADGVVIVAPGTDQPLLRAVAAAGYPAVAAVCDPDDCPISCVNAADFEGARAAVTYLIRLGHRRIGCLTGPPELGPTRPRLEGYRQALMSVGLAVSERFITRTTPEERGGFRAAVELLSRRPRPTALVAFNDLAARGVIDAAHQMGLRVPEQLSVVGFDDAEFAASLHPALTTVRYPSREIGAQAIECLVRLVQNGTLSPQSLIVPTQLVVRDSCAPPATDASH